MKWYISEYQNTKDGTFNYKKDNLYDKQLVFDTKPPRHPGRVRYIEYDSDIIGEKEAVRKFEEKFNVKCKWVSIGYGEQTHLAYKIIEKVDKQ